NTLAAFNDYQAARPNGRHAADAKAAIDRLTALSQRWAQLKGHKSPAQLRQLLVDAKNTEFAAPAEAWLDQVEREDKAAWEKADPGQTRVAYQAYLSGWPEGDYRNDANSRLADIAASEQEWNRIKGKGDEKALQAFLDRPYIADFRSAAQGELVGI